jgi:histidine triad (HIT) family protein
MAYDDNNIFAKILRDEIPAHKVFEDEHSLAFMDVMPQSDGHTLVISKCPAENLFELNSDYAARVMQTTQRVARAVNNAFVPDGLMLNQFNGSVAGQTVFHFHMHIVPRYEGLQLRSHGGGMAADGVLAEHAAKIRAAL